jgi:hypothetical protein
MKVPTYEAQTRLGADVGARPMRVRASPEAFGAAEARAMGGLAEQVGRTALDLNQRQREAADLEARIQKDLQSEQFTNEYMEAVTLASEEAALQPPDQQEAFYDNAVKNIQSKIPQRFEDPVQRQELSLSLERYALSRRVNVRASANKNRLDALVGESAKREMTLRNEAINGDKATSTRAIADLQQIYIDLEEKGLMTDEDVAKRSAQMVKDVQYEREINTINRIKTPEEATAYVNSIRDDERFDPTERRQLMGAVSGMLSKRDDERKAARAKLKDDMGSLRDVIATGMEIGQEQLDAVNLELKMYGTEADARDFDDILAGNKNVQILNNTGTLAGVDSLIRQIESEPTAGLTAQELGYRAQELENAEEYREKMVTAFEGGDALDFLSQRGIVNVEPFDFANLSQSIPARTQNMNKIAASVGVNETTGKVLYPQNFFTDEEAAQFASYLNRATPQQKASSALALIPLADSYPQVYEQIAGKNGELFAMAGAISATTAMASPVSVPDMSIAEAIFDGIQIREQPGYVAPPKRLFAAAFEEAVGDAYRRSPEDEAVMQEAVLSHYAATRKSRGEEINENTQITEIQESIKAVSGGIGEYNDHQFELSRDLEQDEFESIIDGMTPRMLRLFAPNGIDGYTDEQAIELIQRSQITNGGLGYYYPVDPGTLQPFLLTNGKPVPFVINNRRMWNGRTLMDYLPSDYKLEKPTVYSVRGMELSL